MLQAEAFFFAIHRKTMATTSTTTNTNDIFICFLAFLFTLLLQFTLSFCPSLALILFFHNRDVGYPFPFHLSSFCFTACLAQYLPNAVFLSFSQPIPFLLLIQVKPSYVASAVLSMFCFSLNNMPMEKAKKPTFFVALALFFNANGK